MISMNNHNIFFIIILFSYELELLQEFLCCKWLASELIYAFFQWHNSITTNIKSSIIFDIKNMRSSLHGAEGSLPVQVL